MAHNRTRFRRPGSLRLEYLEQRDVPAAGIGTFNAATDTFALRNTASAGPVDTRFQLEAPRQQGRRGRMER